MRQWTGVGRLRKARKILFGCMDCQHDTIARKAEAEPAAETW